MTALTLSHRRAVWMKQFIVRVFKKTSKENLRGRLYAALTDDRKSVRFWGGAIGARTFTMDVEVDVEDIDSLAQLNAIVRHELLSDGWKYIATPSQRI